MVRKNITPYNKRTKDENRCKNETLQQILKSGKKWYADNNTTKKVYKCLIGVRKHEDVILNMKEHIQDLNKATNVFNEVNTECKVKIIRVDVESFAIKVTSNKNILGNDDLFFLCLNAISSNLNLLGFKRYSEATNGRLFYIIDIEEIKDKSDDVVNDKSIQVNIDELIKKIQVLSELIQMGLDEDGSRAIALKEILDTVNNELL